jgi:hypothetical protein
VYNATCCPAVRASTNSKCDSDPTYIYIYTYICINMHTYTYNMYIHIHTHTQTHTYIYIYIYIYIFICIPMYMYHTAKVFKLGSQAIHTSSALYWRSTDEMGNPPSISQNLTVPSAERVANRPVASFTLRSRTLLR